MLKIYGRVQSFLVLSPSACFSQLQLSRFLLCSRPPSRGQGQTSRSGAWLASDWRNSTDRNVIGNTFTIRPGTVRWQVILIYEKGIQFLCRSMHSQYLSLLNPGGGGGGERGGARVASLWSGMPAGSEAMRRHPVPSSRAIPGHGGAFTCAGLYNRTVTTGTSRSPLSWTARQRGEPGLWTMPHTPSQLRQMWQRTIIARTDVTELSYCRGSASGPDTGKQAALWPSRDLHQSRRASLAKTTPDNNIFNRISEVNRWETLISFLAWH